MQILFKSRHPEAALMRDTVERRVRFALRRLNALVPRADVQLADVNGPRGGLDKRCQIALRTDGAGEVVVSSVAGDWRTALDEALARAVRHVLKVWRRATVARGALPPAYPQVPAAGVGRQGAGFCQWRDALPATLRVEARHAIDARATHPQRTAPCRD